MSTLPLVLDSAGLSALYYPKKTDTVVPLLREVRRLGGDVLVPAVICAEVCRGVARTRQVENVIGRKRLGSEVRRQSIDVVPTDFDLARQVGAVLHGAEVGSEFMADAHVVALCAKYNGGMVITSDPDDIMRLSAVLPLTRIVTRYPDSPL